MKAQTNNPTINKTTSNDISKTSPDNLSYQNLMKEKKQLLWGLWIQGAVILIIIGDQVIKHFF